MAKTKTIIIFSIIFFVVFGLVKNSRAATIYAASCSQTDVQQAIDAASDGDTVMVPAGECVWTTPNYSYFKDGYYPAVGIGKNIILKGAGIDSTVIIDGTAAVYNQTPLRIKSGKPFIITGFTFKNANNVAIEIVSTANWRIHNCKFDGGGRGVATVGNSPYGVVDNCIFIGTEVTVFDNEHEAWNRPLTLGTKNAVYVENNVFYEYQSLNDAIDGRSGARIVFRNNELHNQMLHLHGTDGGGARGTHSYEYYGNRLYDDAGLNCYRFGDIRGGTGVIWNNSAFGKWGPLYVRHECACNTNPNDSRCGGAKLCVGYPCLDQIGRTTDHNLDGRQDLAPLFGWNNTVNGIILNMTVSGCEVVHSIYLKEGRDFYNNVVTYNSLTGMYEAQYRDDDGLIKQWKYKPYIYPHPLTLVPFNTEICGEGQITSQCWCEGMKNSGYCFHGYYSGSAPTDTTPPAAPTGVRVE